MRARWRGALGVLALLVPLATCGCGTSAVALPAARKPPCVADDGALVGWLDGDKWPDRVVAGNNGKDTAVQWGTSGGGFGQPVSVRSLLGAGKGETTAAVAADFTGDDELDLAVAVSKAPVGDDPVHASVREVRVGPLHRNGRSGHNLTLDLYENSGLSLADFNHDHRPDVAAWQYRGDGVYGVVPLLGTGTTLTRKGNARWSTQEAAPVAVHLPRAHLTDFYRPCGTDG